MGASMEGKLNAIYFLDEFRKPRRDNRTQFVPVDLWTPANENEVIINCKPGFFIAPLSIIFGLNIDPNDKLNYFMLSTKKCYNSADMRTHLFKYINYFCNYYDPDWEYMSVLLKMKMNMDRYDASAYSAEASNT